jgi:Major royal jelly protein
VTGFGLIVYDYAMDKSWRVDNKLFYPYPNYGTYNIAGETFELMDGLFGLALTPRLQNTIRSKRSIGLRHYGFFGNEAFDYNPEPTDRFLYFHSLAAGTENRVPLRLIDNDTYWEANPGGSPAQFVEIGVRGTQRY